MSPHHFLISIGLRPRGIKKLEVARTGVDSYKSSQAKSQTRSDPLDSARLAQPLARGRRPELEVWHVDVYEALHQLKGREGVVGARVVHDRDPETPLYRDGYRLDHLGKPQQM